MKNDIRVHGEVPPREGPDTWLGQFQPKREKIFEQSPNLGTVPLYKLEQSFYNHHRSKRNRKEYQMQKTDGDKRKENVYNEISKEELLSEARHMLECLNYDQIIQVCKWLDIRTI